MSSNTFQPRDLLNNFQSFAIPVFPGEITFRLEEDETFSKIFCSRNYNAKVLEPLEPVSRVIVPTNTFTFDNIKLKRYNEMTEQNNLHHFMNANINAINVEKSENANANANEMSEKIDSFKRKLNESPIEPITEPESQPKTKKVKTITIKKTTTSSSADSKLNIPFHFRYFIQNFTNNITATELYGNVYVYYQLFDIVGDTIYKKHRPIFDETNFDLCFMQPESKEIKHAKFLERKALCDNIVAVESEHNSESVTSSESLQSQDQYLWFLLHGLKVKDEGYLHNEQIHFLIQELENEYWFFDRKKLVTFIYDKLPQDGSTVSVPKDAIYNVLKMGNRREMKTLVPSEDVKHLVEFVLPIK